MSWNNYLDRIESGFSISFSYLKSKKSEFFQEYYVRNDGKKHSVSKVVTKLVIWLQVMKFISDKKNQFSPSMFKK